MFLAAFAAQRSTETPVEYKDGVVIPLFSSGVSARPFLNQAYVTIVPTPEQRLEIKNAMLELRLATMSLASKMDEVRVANKVPSDWVWNPETMRFTKPQEGSFSGMSTVGSSGSK